LEGKDVARLFYANRQLQKYLDEFRNNPVTKRQKMMYEFDDNEIGRLLRLKRYEQPPPGYFENFLHEFHRRQRDELLRQPLWKIAVGRAQDFMMSLNVARL